MLRTLYFKCLICKQFAVSPFYSSIRGHIICGICQAETDIIKCPTCQADNVSLNTVLERILKSEDITIPCRNDHRGCTLKIRPCDMMVHLEMECDLRNLDYELILTANPITITDSPGKIRSVPKQPTQSDSLPKSKEGPGKTYRIVRVMQNGEIILAVVYLVPGPTDEGAVRVTLVGFNESEKGWLVVENDVYKNIQEAQRINPRIPILMGPNGPTNIPEWGNDQQFLRNPEMFNSLVEYLDVQRTGRFSIVDSSVNPNIMTPLSSSSYEAISDLSNPTEDENYSSTSHGDVANNPHSVDYAYKSFYEKPQSVIRKHAKLLTRFYVGQRGTNVLVLRQATVTVINRMKHQIQNGYCGPIVANEFVHLLHSNLETLFPKFPPTTQLAERYKLFGIAGNRTASTICFESNVEYRWYQSMFMVPNMVDINENKMGVLMQTKRFRQTKMCCFGCPSEVLQPVLGNRLMATHFPLHSRSTFDTLFPCTQCGRWFNTKVDQIEHESTMHINKPEAEEICRRDRPFRHPELNLNPNFGGPYEVDLFEHLDVAVCRYNSNQPEKGWRYNPGQRALSILWLEKAVENVMDFLQSNVTKVAASEMFITQFLILLTAYLRSAGLPLMPPETDLVRRTALFTSEGEGFKFNSMEQYAWFTQIFESKLRIDENNWDTYPARFKFGRSGHEDKDTEFCFACELKKTGVSENIKLHVKSDHMEAEIGTKCSGCGWYSSTNENVYHLAHVHSHINQWTWREEIYKKDELGSDVLDSTYNVKFLPI